ncbi:HPF/RaiA family ribosome-associated protein [Alienimonas sp. DA493]|uniref:HPF/RaiA family ribosome-associated protein n=1 Tax=Alienimonas sp. DA493 TaxID=3373605 RepID=UPI003754A480
MPAAAARENEPFSDQKYNLKLELVTKNCSFGPGELEQMEEDLDALAKLTEKMPVSDLQVTIAWFEHSQEYHVKTSLITPGKTLFTGEHDSVAHPAYQKCVRKLVQKLKAYKNRMETQDNRRARLAEGSVQEVTPDVPPELDALERAIHARDYLAFRQEMAGFDGSLRDRVGRWVQRYPDLNREVGENLPVADIMEEVYLSAYDQFLERPAEMRLGDWLEGLVDPSIRNLLRHPDEEAEEISFARTLREMEASDVHTGPGGQNPDADDPTNAEPGHRHIGGKNVAPVPDAPAKPR